jgi:hypothetical protein
VVSAPVYLPGAIAGRDPLVPVDLMRVNMALSGIAVV